MTTTKREISQEVIDEFLGLAIVHELTMADVDQISYKLRNYYLRNATLKQKTEEEEVTEGGEQETEEVIKDGEQETGEEVTEGGK